MNIDENKYLINRLKVNSSFHIGAYVGEELDFYKEWGVKNIILAEPNPELFARLEENIKNEKYKDMNLIITDNAICDKDGDVVNFHLYYNQCRDNMGCSSIKESELHNKIYPQILYNGTIQVNTTTADLISKSELVDFDIEFLNIDVQGAEYEVFLGAHNLLSTTVKGILVEVADVELYKNQKLKVDIIEFLKQYNFNADTYFPHSNIWGDILFIKEGI